MSEAVQIFDPIKMKAPIKMKEQQDTELICSHKYIKNACTFATILTEHLLNTSRSPQTSKRTRKSPSEAGSMKEGLGEKRKEEFKKRHQQNQWEAEGEEKSLHSEKPPYSEEISWYRKGPQGIEG